MNMDKPKIEPGKWVHNQRVSHDRLIEGLKLLKAGIEDVIGETENQVAKYQQTLLSLTKASNKARR